jgi:hypothetical protein
MIIFMIRNLPMDTKIMNVAIIGLDTSHSVELPKRMQAADCPANEKIEGLRAISCLRFPSPFQTEEGQDGRQKTLEGWGVKVTRNFDEAVANCDAIMIEINDPAMHVDYFKKCAVLGKPMFLDKPIADTLAHGKKIVSIMQEKNLRVFSASSLRFVTALANACQEMPSPIFTSVYGPLGAAAAGSSIVWYGVHAFEMLQRAMGRGAESVRVIKDGAGVVAVVKYPNNRRGIVELNDAAYAYGGVLRTKDKSVPYVVDMSMAYTLLMKEIIAFFHGGSAPVDMATDTLEIMALLEAAQKSANNGREIKITM